MGAGALGALSLGWLACSGDGPEVLATYSGGSLTVADLDRFVRGLPEAERWVPAGADRETWLEQQLRRLAGQRLVETADEVETRLSGAAAEARRRWALAAALAAAVTSELGPATADEKAVEARLAQMDEPHPEPLWSFRHAFFRLDRAATESQRRAVRERAQAVAEQARRGEDFADLVRRHSQSDDAAGGGLVDNQRPSLLEETARRVLAGLAEGEISPVVETRTGLHLFQLERRLELAPPDAAQQRARARRQVAAEAFSAARRELLAGLRGRFEVVAEDLPWRIGGFEVTASDLELLEAMPGGGRQQVIDLLLLAAEGRRRGFLTADVEAGVDLRLRREAAAAVLHRRQAELVAGLAPDRLRPFYDAQPSAFATPELAHLDLIFVPRGRDAFATRRGLEDHVAALRGGAPFADLARRISTGPAAADGGDLGRLPPSEWVRLGPEIYNAVTLMGRGEISDPIYCTDRILSADPRLLRAGFAVVRVREKVPPRKRSFEEAIDGVRAAYAKRHLQELAAELRAKILEEADFEIVRLPTADELLVRTGSTG